MAHANQERWSKLVDAKLRNQLVTRDNYIFNNRYEGDPKAGKVKIPVRDTEVSVKDYNKATGIDPEAGTTTYLELNIDQDEAVNELIDGFDAASVPDGIVADRLDSAGYSLGLSIDKKSIEALQAASGATISATTSSGMSSVVIINDFLRTRSLNSRSMMIPICDIFRWFECSCYLSEPLTARMNMSFMPGMISVKERSSTVSFTAAMTLRTSLSAMCILSVR